MILWRTWMHGLRVHCRPIIASCPRRTTGSFTNLEHRPHHGIVYESGVPATNAPKHNSAFAHDSGLKTQSIGVASQSSAPQFAQSHSPR